MLPMSNFRELSTSYPQVINRHEYRYPVALTKLSTSYQQALINSFCKLTGPVTELTCTVTELTGPVTELTKAVNLAIFRQAFGSVVQRVCEIREISVTYYITYFLK